MEEEDIGKYYYLVQLIIISPGAVSIFPPTFISNTKHFALYIVVLNEYLLKNHLGRGAKVFFSLVLLCSLNLEFLFHGDSYVHEVSLSYLSLLPDSHTLVEMHWKSQPLSAFNVTEL